MENNVKTVKKQPTRRCIGCAEHFPKNELIRVVRKPDGDISIDLTGKMSGRGAYLCKKMSCFNKAKKQRRIEASLECSIPQQVYERLEEELSNGIG